MWGLNALVPDHWHSFNFASFFRSFFYYTQGKTDNLYR